MEEKMFQSTNQIIIDSYNLYPMLMTMDDIIPLII